MLRGEKNFVVGTRVCVSVRVEILVVGSLVGGGTFSKKGWEIPLDSPWDGWGSLDLGLAPCRKGTTDLELAEVLSMIVAVVISVCGEDVGF